MGKGEGKSLIKLGTDRQASGFQGSSFALSLGSVEAKFCQDIFDEF